MRTVKKVKKINNANIFVHTHFNNKTKKWIPWLPFSAFSVSFNKICQKKWLRRTVPTWEVNPFTIINACAVQCPSISCVWSALVLMLTIFHHPKTKIFCSVSYITWQTAYAIAASVFFLTRKLAKLISFDLLWFENCRHQHKGKPNRLEKSQGTATYTKYAITYTVQCVRVK